MLHLRFLVPAVLVAVAGCGGAKEKERFDAQTRAVLVGATRVEVFRIDGEDGPHDRKPKTPGEGRIGGFRVTAQGKEQGKEFASRLADILCDDKTYTRNFASCFWPGVAFRVRKGEEVVEVLICFTCGNLYVGPPTKVARENVSFNGSPLRPRLVRLAKEAFPQDKEIQGLKE